jgi:hypothetical protein
MISDNRYKQLMEQVGIPNSLSLLQVLKQVENEATYEKNKLLDEACQVLESAFNMCVRRDCDGDELNPKLADRISTIVSNIRK